MRNTGLKSLFAVRVSPGIFLLLASYLCQQPAVLDRVPFDFGNWMVFLLSWALPIAVIVLAGYQLIRYRSLQYAVEIGLAVWLLIRALSLIVQAG